MNNHNLTLFKYLEYVASTVKSPLVDNDIEIVKQYYNDGVTVSEAINSIEWNKTDLNLKKNKKFVYDN